MMKTILTVAFLFSMTAPVAMAEPSYKTPEYSGPSARIDQSGMERAGSPDIVKTPRNTPSPANDKQYDRTAAERGKRIQSEMTRRRDGRQGYTVNQ